MKTKQKSTLLFVVSVLVIGILAYVGVFGLNIGGYRLRSFNETIKKGLDLKGGISILEEIQQANPDKDTIDRTISLITMRVNPTGVSEISVNQEGKNRIRIDIPDKFNLKEVEDIVSKSGKLTFRAPDGSIILEGNDVKDATAGADQSGQGVVNLKLNTSGTKKFAEATEKYLGQKIAIYMDEDMVTNPVVQAIISNGEAQISGSYTLEQAKKEADIIKGGALPVPVKTVSSSIVGATLGANALPNSVKAVAVGIGLIFLFMILYYRIPGIMASIALLLYSVLTLGAFSAIGAALTLSGIAGFLLSVGMAVDANVLIFERMKEELKSGKSIKASIDAGFHRAMSSILDTNATTIISGIVLYWLGTGPVKGFALTLMIGAVISVFTAVTVTRFLITNAANMGWFDKKWSIGTFGVRDMRKGLE